MTDPQPQPYRMKIKGEEDSNDDRPEYRTTSGSMGAKPRMNLRQCFRSVSRVAPHFCVRKVWLLLSTISPCRKWWWWDIRPSLI